MSTAFSSETAHHAEWEEYAALLDAAHKAHLPEIKLLFRDLPLANARRVLDVPCGDGFYSALLAENLPLGSEVVALDNDEEALAALSRQIKDASGGVRIHCQSGDAFALPFEDASFDFVWCAQSLISLSEPEKPPEESSIRTAFAEIHRVLRPGGQVAVLEQDAIHHVMLPWPGDFELAIRQAERKGFRELYGHPEQLEIGRHLGKLLAHAGFHPLRRMTVTADRKGIPFGNEQAFLRAYFAELRKRVHANLTDEELHRFDRMTNWKSGESFFYDPHFEMTWMEFVVLGLKP